VHQRLSSLLSPGGIATATNGGLPSLSGSRWMGASGRERLTAQGRS
jgi:hypothetical protein